MLVGLSAAKILTEKRIEFFREAASGYDVNAYFLAANITSTIEHSLQTVIAAGAAYWIRDSLADWWTYLTTFLMLSWLSVSWALLLPLLVTPKNVVVVIAFFMAFFGLLSSGGIAPVLYSGKPSRGLRMSSSNSHLLFFRHLQRRKFRTCLVQWFRCSHSILYRGPHRFGTPVPARTERVYGRAGEQSFLGRKLLFCFRRSSAKRSRRWQSFVLWVVLGCAAGLSSRAHRAPIGFGYHPCFRTVHASQASAAGSPPSRIGKQTGDGVEIYLASFDSLFGSVHFVVWSFCVGDSPQSGRVASDACAQKYAP